MSDNNLREKAKLAVYWNTGFNLFRDALQFGVMLVLVRIIPPEAYGQFGMVNAIIGFISVFSFASFITHTLQIRKIEDIDYQTHFTAGFFIQIFVLVITICIALIIDFFPEYRSIKIIIIIMSLGFLFQLPGELQRKIYEKKLEWKRMRLLDLIGMILYSLLAILFGLLGFKIYALLLPSLLTGFPFIYELFIKNKWRPDWSFNKEKYKETIKFALAQSGISITGKVQPLIESSVFTSVIGFYGFGIYGRAIGLSRMASEKFVSQLLYATYPVLTSIDTKNEQYKKALSTLVIIILSFIIPVSIIFALNAETIILLLYGNKWIAVIPLLPFTIIIVSLSALNTTFYNILLSYYKQNLLFSLSISSLVINILLLFFVLHKSITFYLYGLVILQLCLLTVYFILSRHYKLLNINFIIKNAIGLIGIALASYVPLFLINKYFGYQNNLIQLFGVILYFIIYIILLRIFMKETFLIINNYLPFKEKVLIIFRLKN